MGKPDTDAAGTMGLDISDWEKKIDLLIRQEKQFEAMAAKMGTSVKVVKDAFTKLAKEQEKQQKEQEKSNKQVGIGTKAFNLLTKAAAAFGIAFTIGAAVQFGRAILSFGKNTSDAAKTSDLSSESFQRLRSSLMKFVDTEDASQAIGVLAKTLRDAKNEVPDAQRKFKALGVEFGELKDKGFDTKAAMERLAEGYANASNKTEYLRRVSEVFGDDLARKLEPALASGGKALKAYGASATVAKDDILDLSKEGELALGRLADSTKRLTLSLAGLTFSKLPSWLSQHIGDTLYGPQSPNTHASNRSAPDAPATPAAPNVAEKALADAQKSRLDFETDIARVESKRDLTLSSELDILDAQIKLAQQNAVIARDQGQEMEEQVELAKIRNAELAQANLLFQRGQELLAATSQTRAIEFQITGQERLAKLEEMRASYAGRIADAERVGNDELSRQLHIQQAISELAQRAAMHARTPQQRAEENREARKLARELRAQATREREGGKTGEYQSQLGGGAAGMGSDPLHKAYDQQLSEGGGAINPRARMGSYAHSSSQISKSSSMAALLKSLENIATNEIKANKISIPMK